MQHKPYLEQKIKVQLRELTKNIYENSQPVLPTFTKFSFSDEGPSLGTVVLVISTPTSLYFPDLIIFRQLPYISPTFSYFADLFIFRFVFLHCLCSTLFSFHFSNSYLRFLFTQIGYSHGSFNNSTLSAFLIKTIFNAAPCSDL